jgi:hypothetical protein
MIDLTKKYQTRSGLPVRIYAVDGGGTYPVHGSFLEAGTYFIVQWMSDGCFCPGGVESSCDLVPVKEWRAWKEGEGPARLMIRWNNHCKDSVEVVHRSVMYSNAYLFENATWLHEDGSETPCGVEE